MKKSILITGAGGFIGGFLVNAALDRGYDVWAAVRSTTNREFLKDERIRFIELDYEDQDKLEEAEQAAVASTAATAADVEAGASEGSAEENF